MIWRSEFIKVYVVTMLTALCLLSCSSDDTLSSTASSNSVPVSLAMNISTSRVSTRMTEAVTQQAGQDFRGIDLDKLYLLPFSCVNPVGDNEALSSPVNALVQPYEQTLNYYVESQIEVPEGTRSFLCYTRAVPEADKFVNGSLTANIPFDTEGKKTGDISFSPEVIHNSNDVETTLSNIAEYLTAIAEAVQGTAGKEELYRLLTNGSVAPDAKNHTHLLACSSTNVAQLATWVAEQGVTLPAFDTTNKPITGYPASINLPDGVAVVKWNYTSKEFEPQVQTNTEVNNINSLNRFVYPAELYYYANSAIKTSTQSQREHYGQTWANVLSNYEIDNAVTNGTEASIAIKDPLRYAVGCLQVGLNVQNPLEDATGEKTISLTGGENASFPLTAILVSSQFVQGYDFTPKGEGDEYIIYDNQIKDYGISMGGSIVSIPTTPSQYTNTLVLQTKDNENVRFALEFENNSGEDFEGINGKVFDGSKFYLVGTIEVPAVVDQDKDFKKRVFTKNHITQGTVTISSLKDAYTYLPDLLDPRLEVGIQLVPNWIQVTTTNVPL